MRYLSDDGRVFNTLEERQEHETCQKQQVEKAEREKKEQERKTLEKKISEKYNELAELEKEYSKKYLHDGFDEILSYLFGLKKRRRQEKWD